MAVQLRSGRRLAPAPPPPPRGCVRRARPRRSHADEEDRISDLPEELRLEVLRRLGCAREAARTSVLSSRWRGLWTELRDLNFKSGSYASSGISSLSTALAMVRSGLNRLRIHDYKSGSYASSGISSLLRAADRLAPVELHVALDREYSNDPFEIPCFEHTTSIDLFINRLNDCKLPPAGQFAALEQLSLSYGFLNPSVFLHRCPRLRKLDMEMDYPRLRGREVNTLIVESKSLEELTWWIARGLDGVRIVVVAPELKKFRLSSPRSGEFTVSLSASKLEEFHLEYSWEHSRVRSGEKWNLCELKMATEWSSRHGPGQLQNVLSLTILNDMKSLPAERSVEQEVARLPVNNFAVLELSIRTEGHVFGALVLQLLRIRTTIQRLKVVRLKDRFPHRCSENCDCDEASDWRNEQLSLPNLEVVEFEGLRGEDHELDFLHLLFGSAPMLKRMRVELFDQDSLASGACQKLHSIFAANASVECSVLAKSG